MKKVIITGATGMIGLALNEYLLRNNVEITLIIRENSSRKDSIPNNSNLKIIECNLDNLKNLNLPYNDYDVFFHLAWDGTFGESRNDENKQKMNIEFTMDAVRLASKCGCKVFIGAGSQAEFGRVEGLINETTIPNPETEYGKAKLQAGIKSRELANKLGLKHIWTRIFSVYGPYDTENTMVMSSIREMLKGDSPEYTLGEQNWDYLFSEDAAKALFLLAEYGIENKTYCIATGKTRKLYEYIEIIKNIINPNIKLKLGAKPYAKNQVMNLNVDISDLINDTKFVPEFDFENGIKNTINWYKKYKNIS
ncbi:MAG: NAD(P)-dependent oxidoreductase [Clostridia bacterium]|nr:NAD(P)-dependent oxidoreductase [Clostridia bacterium]